MGIISAAVFGALVLGLGVPVGENLLLTPTCSKIGGQLQRSTADAEPVAKGRIVYSCFGADGRLLDTW